MFSQTTIQLFIIWTTTLAGALILHKPTIFIAAVLGTFLVTIFEFIINGIANA